MISFLDLAATFQICGRMYFRSYWHEMTMREIARDGRSKAKHLRNAVRYQKLAADNYASARKAMDDAKRWG